MSENAYAPEQLPAVIRRYLHTPRGRDGAAVVEELFTSDATVVDERTDHVGTAAIRDWFANAATEYTYTTTYRGQTAHTPQLWTVVARLEGDFPGGEAELRYRFRLREDRIAELVIEP